MSTLYCCKTRRQYSRNDNSAPMQKSKSLSNVPKIISKRIWKGRSKSQTRTASPTKAEWTPLGKCIWSSDSGRQVRLMDASLQNLTEVESKILQRVAIEKINQLNIGVNVVAPSDAETASKPQKRRPLITSCFFDSGQTDDTVGVFGNTLENCVAIDQKRRSKLIASSDSGSRNSINSIFRGRSRSMVPSCESFSSGFYNHPHYVSSPSHVHGGGGMDCDDWRGAAGTGNEIRSKSTTMQMSHSQSDVRRSIQDYDYMYYKSMTASPPTFELGEPAERQVPTFIYEWIKHLENHGLHSVGIFRVCASRRRVRQMREEFDQSTCTSIDPETCPHDVATLLKEFLREMPEPLLCANLYNPFMKTQKITNRRLQLNALSHLVQLLPIAHRDTLYVLLRFLAKVASCCDDILIGEDTVLVVGNKMDSNNLATVFAPNILRSTMPCKDGSLGDGIKVIRTMIDYYDELFRVPAELMDEIYANMIDTFPEQLNYLCERRTISNIGSMSTQLDSAPEQQQADVSPNNQEFLRASGQFDLSNIPCIDYSSYGNEIENLNEGSLSFGDCGSGGGYGIVSGCVGGAEGGGKNSSTIDHRKFSTASQQNSGTITASKATVYQISIIYESKQLSSPAFVGSAGVGDAHTAALLSPAPPTVTSSQQKVTSTTTTLHSWSMPPSGPSDAADLQIEPKLPPSISNIGGDIPRSKTAAFERNSAAMPVAGASNAPDALRRVEQPTALEAGASPRSTLGRLKELLSSAKRTFK